MYFPDFNPKKCQSAKLRHPEVIAPLDKVERYGYVPFAERVQKMEQAGLNLLLIRAEMCDFKSDDAIDFDRDFHRTSDFDRFQLDEMQKEISERYSKLNDLIVKQKMIQSLREQGYTVSEATDLANDPVNGATKGASESEKPPVNEQ